MSLAMTMDTVPAGTVCKSFDAGSLEEIDIFNLKTGLNLEFQPFQFKEVVKAFLTGESEWNFDDFYCEVRPCHDRLERYGIVVKQPLLGPNGQREQMVFIGPDDFWAITEYWMTNTRLKENDARLVLLAEIDSIEPAPFAKNLYDTLNSMEAVDVGGSRRQLTRRNA
jgi:hypothetical protein